MWLPPARSVLLAPVLCATALCLPRAPVQAQPQPTKLESCKPVSERTGVNGCWILTSAPLGPLPASPVFWTLDLYPTRDSADAAASHNSTVVEALGKVWLFTVGDKISPAPHATRVAQIGPLLVKPGEPYTAQYREAIMQPGGVSRTHLHSGPEAFYTETGETCLETPSGTQLGRKGADIIAPEGDPMELVATGSDTRRGIVLVLHPSARPHTTMVSDWTSKGLCKQNH